MPSAAKPTPTAPVRSGLRANLLGGVVGNVLEWYDFAVYGFFAPIIASQFFPAGTTVASLLGAFGVFAGAYLMRPLGGALFGHIGDRLGRKTALQISVLLMALPTATIGLLPTYASVGLWAPVLLVLLRLAQGLSVGGELVGSISFISEMAPPGRRGYYGSFALCSSTAGVLLGSLVALTLQEGLTPQQLTSWGWRLPFLAGIAIGLFGLWMREGMEETPAFRKMQQEEALERSPVRRVLADMPERVGQVAFLVVLTGGGFYMLFVWWPTFLSKLLRPPVPHALLVNSLAMVVLMAAIPLAGWLSDQLGRKAVMVLGALGIALAAHPLFHAVDHGNFASALMAQSAFALLMSLVTGPAPAMMVELFPARLRFSGIAVGYNISLALFGGTAPLVSTWLVGHTGNALAPSYYLILLAVLSLTAAITAPQEVVAAAPPPRTPPGARALSFPLPPQSGPSVTAPAAAERTSPRAPLGAQAPATGEPPER